MTPLGINISIKFSDIDYQGQLSMPSRVLHGCPYKTQKFNLHCDNPRIGSVIIHLQLFTNVLPLNYVSDISQNSSDSGFYLRKVVLMLASYLCTFICPGLILVKNAEHIQYLHEVIGEIFQFSYEYPKVFLHTDALVTAKGHRCIHLSYIQYLENCAHFVERHRLYYSYF